MATIFNFPKWPMLVARNARQKKARERQKLYGVDGNLIVLPALGVFKCKDLPFVPIETDPIF